MKTVSIILGVVLAITLIAGGLVISQQIQQKNALTSDLTAANTKITGLEGDIVGLKGNVSDLEGKLTASQGEVSSLTGKLTDSETKAAGLQKDLDSAKSSISSLQSDVSAQRTINSSLTADLKKVRSPRHFSSLQELTDWITKDDTNTKYASERPSQIGFILQVRALRDGYLLPVALYVEGTTIWVGNRAVIGDGLYAVSPSSDSITKISTTQPLPSQPLSD